MKTLLIIIGAITIMIVAYLAVKQLRRMDRDSLLWFAKIPISLIIAPFVIVSIKSVDTIRNIKTKPKK